MNKIVDTNIILRYLVGDQLELQKQAITIFQKAEHDKFKLIIKPLVIAECCFVLESFYHKSRLEITNTFKVFLAQRWLIVEDRDIMLNLWKWYVQNLHFVDSYLLSWSEANTGEIISFDKKLVGKATNIITGKK